MQLILLGGFSFGKMWKNMEKRLIGEIPHGWLRPDWCLKGEGTPSGANDVKTILERLILSPNPAGEVIKVSQDKYFH